MSNSDWQTTFEVHNDIIRLTICESFVTVHSAILKELRIRTWDGQHAHISLSKKVRVCLSFLSYTFETIYAKNIDD